jgi:signal transduction histidine kinase
MSDMPESVVARFDLRTATPWESIAGAFGTLLRNEPRMMLVVGDAPMGAEFIEITLDEGPLRQAMWRYSANILVLSLIISGIVAMLGVIALHLLVVAPVRRLTSSLIAFGDGPQDSSRVIEPSGSQHEIGRAEEALAQMQARLLTEFRQTKHLAALGLAVAKINHDLRNLLSTAQLLSDRLADSPDALARSVAPKLIGTLDRAIAFCQSTLVYGRAVEPAPRMAPFPLRALVAEAAEVVAPHGVDIQLVNDVAEDFVIEADREQIFRVLVNLMRNAVEALLAAGPQPGRAACVRVSARRSDGRVRLTVSDTGPGVPQRARASLFEAFHGSTRPGGAGLGLAIAAELAQAHGGTVRLLDDAPDGGAAFCVELPDRTNGRAPAAPR